MAVSATTGSLDSVLPEDDSDDSELMMYANELSKIPFRACRRPWFADDRIMIHIGMQQLSSLICAVMSRPDLTVGVSTVKAVHLALSEKTTWYLRELNDAVPEQDDEYAPTPLLMMYTSMAMCLAYVARMSMLDTPVFMKKSTDIPYCTENKLVVSPNRIADYSVMELFGALERLQKHLRFISCELSFFHYLDALEARFSELMVYSYTHTTHNVEDMRVRLAEGEYALTVKASFEGALHFISLREEASSALLNMRCEVCGELALLVPSDAEVENLLTHLQEEATRVHSDSVADGIRRDYQRLSVTPSEAYMFLKHNTKATDIEPYKLIQEDLKQVQRWRDICERAGMRPDEILKACVDPLGMRVTLHLLMDVLLQQDAKIMWAVFNISQPTLIMPDQRVVDILHTRSRSVPLYATCMNDSCVFFQGKIYSMGSEPLACIRALGFWLNIVKQRCVGRLDENTSFNALYYTLTGSHFAPNMQYAVLPEELKQTQRKKKEDSEWGEYL